MTSNNPRDGDFQIGTYQAVGDSEEEAMITITLSRSEAKRLVRLIEKLQATL